MSREDALMQLIKIKYKSLRNFSLESGIPNSTLNSMFKKGLGGTAFDTVFKVCSLLGCDIYTLTNTTSLSDAVDRAFFSDYLKLDLSSKELVRMVTHHQLSLASQPAKEESSVSKAREIEFPTPNAVPMKTIRIYLNSASAGFGEYLEDSDYEEIAMDSQVPSDADFGITIHGDSMLPQINDGDVVWVRQQDSVSENQIGVFVLNGDALCKKLIVKGTQFFLRSLNDKYRDIPITEYDSLKVIGRVIDATPFPAY